MLRFGKDGERMDDELAKRVRAHCESKVGRLTAAYGAPGPAGGHGQRPPDDDRWDYGGHRSREYPWRMGERRRDAQYDFLDGVARLAFDAVRGAGELAARLAELAAGAGGDGGGGGYARQDYRYLPLFPFLPPVPLPYPFRGGSPPGSGALLLSSVAPDGTTTGDLELQNTTDEWIDNVALRCGALVGPGTEMIPGSNVTFDPPVLDLRPWGHHRVRLCLKVPERTLAGQYTGVIAADTMPGVNCVVTVNVA